MNNMVSIIIPTFNRAHIIGETLDTILDQTYPHWECIVVDDGSTDTTAQVLEAYMGKDARFTFLQRPKEKKKGPNSCRNFGFEKSKGTFVHFMDSDDLYSREALQTYLEHFTDNLDAVIAPVEQVHLKTGEFIGKSKCYSKDLIAAYIKGSITFYVCGAVWRRDFLTANPVLFDETITNMDDWDFNLRMLYRNPNLFFLEGPLIQYRIHENSLYHQLKKLHAAELQSDIQARKKHMALVAKKDKKTYGLLKASLCKRYVKFFRKAIILKDPLKHLFFYKMIFCFVGQGKFILVLNFTKGYLLYLMTGKSNRFIRKNKRI